MPFDYNWEIKPDYERVTRAIIKLSSIVCELSSYEWSSSSCLIIKSYMWSLYNQLKAGLLAYGCSAPPEIIETSTNADTIHEMSEQILFLQFQTDQE